MKIWKNTSTLDGYDEGLNFTEFRSEAELALLGSKNIDLNKFPNLKAIFRAGIGRDNVPEKEASKRGIIVKFPNQKTCDIIYNETANFACYLIFRMLYSNIGNINDWVKVSRNSLSSKNLLVIGNGRIGGKVLNRMNSFLNVASYDTVSHDLGDLKKMIKQADCVTIHIPKTKENINFFDSEKLSWMKNGAAIINTSRGQIVNESDLYKELKNKRIRASFDVFWNEPYEGKLKSFYPDPFFMTPHVASTCEEFLIGCRTSIDNLINHFYQI